MIGTLINQVDQMNIMQGWKITNMRLFWTSLSILFQTASYSHPYHVYVSSTNKFLVYFLNSKSLYDIWNLSRGLLSNYLLSADTFFRFEDFRKTYLVELYNRNPWYGEWSFWADILHGMGTISMLFSHWTWTNSPLLFIQ